MRIFVALWLAVSLVSSNAIAAAPIIDAKAIPAGPLFQAQERDTDHPNELVIRCYRNVQRITDDRRYRLFDHRLQRYGGDDFKQGNEHKNGIFTEQDDFKRPLNARIRLMPQQRKAIKEGKFFLYYGYDSQIYLVEDKPEIFLEPAKEEYIRDVSPFPLNNQIIVTRGWGLPVTCIDITTKVVLWQWVDIRPNVRTPDIPNWDWYGHIYWLNSKYLACIDQGRKASLISIFDAEAKQFVKGTDIATWFRIVGDSVLQIDNIKNSDGAVTGRKVSTYFSAHAGK